MFRPTFVYGPVTDPAGVSSHLRRNSDKVGGRTTELTGFALPFTFHTCPTFDGAAVQCPGPNSSLGTSFSIDPNDARTVVPDAPMVFDAAYYAVDLLCVGPQLSGESSECVTMAAPTSPGPCPGAGAENVWEGTFTGSYLDGSGNSRPASFKSGPPAFATPTANHFGEPVHAWLVNPSPVVPSPDAQGNTFGRCLFTKAQLAAVAVTFTHTNNYEDGPAQLSVSVFPFYYEAVAGAGTVRQQTLVGSA